MRGGLLRHDGFTRRSRKRIGWVCDEPFRHDGIGHGPTSPKDRMPGLKRFGKSLIAWTGQRKNARSHLVISRFIRGYRVNRLTAEDKILLTSMSIEQWRSQALGQRINLKSTLDFTRVRVICTKGNYKSWMCRSICYVRWFVRCRSVLYGDQLPSVSVRVQDARTP